MYVHAILIHLEVGLILPGINSWARRKLFMMLDACDAYH
jgi:hypothetical protein